MPIQCIAGRSVPMVGKRRKGGRPVKGDAGPARGRNAEEDVLDSCRTKFERQLAWPRVRFHVATTHEGRGVGSVLCGRGRLTHGEPKEAGAWRRRR